LLTHFYIFYRVDNSTRSKIPFFSCFVHSWSYPWTPSHILFILDTQTFSSYLYSFYQLAVILLMIHILDIIILSKHSSFRLALSHIILFFDPVVVHRLVL
jgi:hypothetical protein